jgi:hypothetical protein
MLQPSAQNNAIAISWRGGAMPPFAFLEFDENSVAAP